MTANPTRTPITSDAAGHAPPKAVARLARLHLMPEQLRRIGPKEYEELAERAAAAMSDGQADALSVRLFFNLLRVGNRLSKDFEVAIRQSAGLSFAGYQLLFSLKSVGPINPNLLARIASVSTASMSSLLNTLERKELISREADPEDGRRTIVRLTEAGETLVESLYLQNMDREQAWSLALTHAEAVQLSELLAKLLMHRPRPYGEDPGTQAFWAPEGEPADHAGPPTA
ncbi:MAG: MarR family transcriptional regulator [Micrococcus sp.]|nr:MarR family transcriptional regulator [Micrococcus sp.]